MGDAVDFLPADKHKFSIYKLIVSLWVCYKIQHTKTLFLIRKTSHKITIVRPNIFYIIHNT